MRRTNAPLKIQLFGSFHVVLDGTTITSFRSDAQRVLLAYLAAHRGSHLRRDTLAALLSPDRDNRSARKYLRNRLDRLRQTIGDRVANPPYLHTDRSAIGLTAGDHVWVDVADFRQQVEAVRQHRHRTLAGCTLCLDRLRQVTGLWRGELLAGLNYPSDIWETWLLAQRAQFRQDAIWALTALGDAHAAQEQWQMLLDVAQKLLGIEPWHEKAHQFAIQAHLRLGDRAAAAAQLARCQTVLWEELGIEPDEATKGLLASTENPPTPPAFANLHNLPDARMPFFGRKSPLTQVQSLLGNPQNRVVTLVGIGGVGKTRLAQEAGRKLVGSFPDGVWFVPLAGIGEQQTTDQIATAIAQAFSFTFTQTTSPLTQLTNFLRKAELLLILDNLEQIIDDAADVVETLLTRTRHVAILCTSRESLNLVEELVVPLGGLTVAEKPSANKLQSATSPAIALFTERARRTDATFTLNDTTLPAVARIGDLVGGSPLGLELAATWTRTRSLEQIVSAIEASADFLSTRRRDMPKRHRSMRAVFNTSWKLLEPDEQLIFAKLTVFRGGFSAEAARTVADATLDDLDLLIEKSLVQRSGNRYAVHELLRQFGEEQRDEIRPKRFITYYLHLLAKQNKPLISMQPLAAARLIEQNERNIWQAWQWALDSSADALLNTAVAPLADYYFLRGRYFEAEGLFRAASKYVSTDRSLLATIQAQHARFLFLLGRFQEAVSSGEAALALQSNLPLASLTIGESLLQQGRFEAASHQLEQAKLGASTIVTAQSIRKLGVLTAISTGDFTEATRHFEEAQQLFEQVGYPCGSAWASSNLGTVAMQNERFVIAQNLFEQAHELFQRIDHMASAGLMQVNLGTLFSEQHNFVAAHRAYSEGHKICTQVGDTLGEAKLLGSLGWVSRKLGRLDQAGAYARQSIDQLKTLGSTLEMSKANSYLGSVAYHKRDLDSAQIYQQTALELAESVGNPAAIGYAQLGLALAKGQSGFGEFTSVLEHASQHKLQALELEARAGLALVMAEKDFAAAQAVLASVKQHIAKEQHIFGVEEPGLLYWALYQLSDPATQATQLAYAYQQVQQLASQLQAETARAQFIQGNYFYCAIVAAYQRQATAA
ncbi:MAG: BTAD domain-containing putative transcriptional regulator [Candidatus Promineifilaceae bacterium]